MDGPRHDPLPQPRQRRSRETLARILDAFESALETRTFEEITVAELCAGAGCSVGTFYGRVESKEALLSHLQARHYAEMAEATEGAFDPARWADVGLEDMLRAHAELVVQLHGRRRGVVRAVIVEARRRSEFARRTEVFNRELLDRVSRVWSNHADEIAHVDAEDAARQAALMAAGYVREAIVFSELWPRREPLAREVYERRVTEALTHMLIAYLMVPPRPPTQPQTRQGADLHEDR